VPDLSRQISEKIFSRMQSEHAREAAEYRATRMALVFTRGVGFFLGEREMVQGVNEVDLFQVYLTAARQPSARICRPHLGLAHQIPVGSASRDHPRRRSKGQMAA
jgi:hypothetical protein